MTKNITLTREQLEAWVGHRLTDDQVKEIDECIPNSSIPQAIASIALEALGITDPNEESTKTRAAVAVVVEDGYMVGFADLNVPGYTPTTYTYDSYEGAKAAAGNINESWGLTPDEALEIVTSSMRAGQ